MTKSAQIATLASAAFGWALVALFSADIGLASAVVAALLSAWHIVALLVLWLVPEPEETKP